MVTTVFASPNRLEKGVTFKCFFYLLFVIFVRYFVRSVHYVVCFVSACTIYMYVIFSVCTIYTCYILCMCCLFLLLSKLNTM